MLTPAMFATPRNLANAGGASPYCVKAWYRTSPKRLHCSLAVQLVAHGARETDLSNSHLPVQHLVQFTSLFPHAITRHLVHETLRCCEDFLVVVARLLRHLALTQCLCFLSSRLFRRFASLCVITVYSNSTSAHPHGDISSRLSRASKPISSVTIVSISLKRVSSHLER